MSGTKQNPQQAEASDPRNSAWVSANAGSGKTTVLVRRVIRLLLDGVPPGRILCLTYTKAAAAHMANKVLQELAKWIRLDDEALDRQIELIESAKPDAVRRARARRLFAAALETPGGLKVQTIHAFCDRVLHMFPVEAEVPAGFEILDEAGERDLIETARIDALLEAGRNPDSEIGRALRYCVEESGDETIEQAIGECLRARSHLLFGSIAEARDAILGALDLDKNDNYDSVVREILDGGSLPRAEWMASAEALQALGKNAAKTGAALAAAAASTDEAVDAYLAIFFTAEGKPKADPTLGKKDDLTKLGHLSEWLFAERERLVPLLNRLRANEECERSCALLTLASDVIARYEEAKRRRGVLDFADLVTKTVALLEREASAWVHYKLDGGIQHILVDEAQDTSPEQWRIVAKLAEEFFAGEGAFARRRSIFVVGDEKQSIFSFQGADPQRFGDMKLRFATQVRASGAELLEPRLRASYRSAKTVLRAVDQIFSFEDARRGLAANETEGPMHEAVRQNAPGMVEIWPPLEAENGASDDDGWDKPLDRMRETSAKMRLATQIAKAVSHWTHGGLTIADRRNNEQPRQVAPGDIIVLVQSRGLLFDAILRALKQARVEVAGADRLTLTENIAVMDMMALGDALLLGEDDLSLACVLKSPLFGFDDDDLFALCHTRENTLLRSLQTATGKPAYAEAANLLTRWHEQAVHLRPFDFYSRVLGRDGGRKKMIARLGPEAADALDEFLSAALAYEKMETPSLQGFLRHLRRAEAEVKRDLETESRAVRVMTVHGVKGLEAPVIVLADTTALPHPTKEPRVIPVHKAGAGADDRAPLIWAAGKKESSTVVMQSKDHARELRLKEYRRLLYVALTRAEDVLVVCGALNKNEQEAQQNSWYDLVHRAIADDVENVTEHETGYSDEKVLRWRTTDLPKPAAAGPVAKPPTAAQVSWLREVAAHHPAARVKLRPSFSILSATAEQATSQERGGRNRGILIHRLLQSLPELANEERHAAALRYLAQAAPELDDASRAKLADEAIRVIGHPSCAALFGPGSRAEPELVARVREGAREIEIAARVDRLIVSEAIVTLADFKSDLAVPASTDAVPAQYVAQLAAYRRALGEAFPERSVRALLVYTAAPVVFEIPKELLESAWQQLKTQGSPAFARPVT